MLKYGVVQDGKLFAQVSRDISAFYQLDLEVAAPVIRRCVEIKAEIVAADERDLGLRHILNHGHTFGHALERAGALASTITGKRSSWACCWKPAWRTFCVCSPGRIW